MPNGDEQAIWATIRAVERDIHNLARDGCGHKTWHEKTSSELRSDLLAEVLARGEMGDKLFKKLDNLMLLVVGALGGIIMILLKPYLSALFGK